MKVRSAVLMLLALTFAAAAQTNDAPQGLFPFSGYSRQEIIKQGPVQFTITRFEVPAQPSARLNMQGVMFMLKTTDDATLAYKVVATGRFVNGAVFTRTFTVSRQTEQPDGATFSFLPLSEQAITIVTAVDITELK